MRKDTCPAGWRLLEKGCTRWAFPKSSDKNNKQLLADIAALPVVKDHELKEVLKYGNYVYSSGGGLGWSTVPNVSWKKECVLISVPESCEYKPVADMVEITVSEYNNLLENK